MRNRVFLEICVESVERAVAAERAGADRIELCTDLSCGGISPSTDLIDSARQALRIPVHVLIRPRAGTFVYSEAEFEIMRHEICAAKKLGVDGIVVGVLQPDNRVDVARTAELVRLSHPLPVTFHRAFDLCWHLESSLEDVIETGAARILTSAGRARATEALSDLAQLVQAAGERISIMPCGGVSPDSIVSVLEATSAREVHSSAVRSNPNPRTGSPSHETELAFEQSVSRMAAQLRQIPPQFEL